MPEEYPPPSPDVIVRRDIADAVRDLLWKATPYGTTEDGDIHAYLIPKGAVHRLVGVMQGAGLTASLRSMEPFIGSSTEPAERPEEGE